MIKLFIFKNILRLKNKTYYKINTNDINLCKHFSIEQWTKIVYEYASISKSTYNIHEMINLYNSNQIKIDRKKEPIYHNYDDVDIYNRYAAINKFGIHCLKNEMKQLLQRQKKEKREDDKFLISILKDDNIYETASVWFIIIKNKLTTVETNLCCGNKIHALTSGDHKKPKEMYYASSCFSKFCFEELNCFERYRILPEPPDGRYMWTCINDSGAIDDVPKPPDGNIETNLGDGFIKYSRFNNPEANTLESIKEFTNYGR